MNIYLCGPCDSENRTIMKNVAITLRELNEEVYCPFELKIENAWSYCQEEWAQRVFEKDIEAINKCDCVIMISCGRISSAGTNWEQGYAFALGKPVYVLQITNEPTSLMTFCGCNYFKNSSISNLQVDIKWLLNAIKKDKINNYSKLCNTVLT